MTIEDKLIYNNNKLVADKILRTLTNIRNIPGISAKRFIWELIQNAKDVPNEFGPVKIIIELNKDSFIFRHNGKYFSIDNVLGILQQISSKTSEKETGKFGTGFIGTHLLSDIIDIKGILEYQGLFRNFEIHLDRSATTSEELLNEVSKSILDFKDKMNINNNNHFEVIDNYYQSEDQFDTSFKYIFKNDYCLQIAQEGIKDLINTVPATMSAQYENIASITIKDNINNEENKYTIEISEGDEEEKNIKLSTVTITSNKNEEKKIYFYFYENDICRLLYQVDKKENQDNEEISYVVVERNKNQPILFRDFPLIGSENFHFPFFLDGFKFDPFDTRNGLYLNGESNKEAKNNREIIEKAISSSIDLTKWLLKQGIDKRYLLAKTNIPEPPQKYDDYAINWFIDNQKKWRKNLIELELLRNQKNTYIKLKQLKLPQFNKKYNHDFFNLLKEINITSGTLPHEKDIAFWYDIMENDPLKKVYNITDNTWDFDYLFTEEDLFKRINGYETIKNGFKKNLTESKVIF